MGVCNDFDINQNGGDCSVGSTGGIGAVWDSRGYIYRTGGNDYDPTGNTYASGDIISCAFDVDTGKIWWAKNGVWHFSGNPAAGTTPKFTASGFNYLTPLANAGSVSGTGWTFNFGQDSSFHGLETAQGNQDDNGIGDFYYEPPSGFLALCTSNLAAPEIADPTAHFNTTIWTGDTSTYPTSRSLTGVGFKPDFVWAKVRSTTGNSSLYDAVRGAEEYLASSESDGETNQPGSGYLTSFDSDGSSWADGASNGNNYNQNAATYVSWNWKGDGTAGGTLNQDGSIDSYVNVNTTAGFSIVKYTSPGSDSDETIGHGLSQRPDMVMVKNRDSAYNWDVWTPALSSGYDLK
ncbi:MAG: hypothetical protein QF535_16045, partial [Anaerolineales bacterium]|nr:hypothetical protein [Anaerolineales bacterium]